MKHVCILVASLMAFTPTGVSAVDSTIFNDDHDFMKGFETGIMMRSKQTKVEDFGCSIPDEKHEFKFIFDPIQSALATVERLIPSDNAAIVNSFKMINEFVGALSYFMMVISDDSSQYLDMYCRGMIFGNKGSSMLVRIANVIKVTDVGQAVDSASAASKRSKKKKKGGIF